MGGSSRRVIGAVILLALIFFYKLAFTDLILARGDTYAYFYPYWAARDTALAAGQIPLWTPDLFMGAPLLANSQLGTFYFPNWLTIRLAAPDAIRVSVLIHSVWAALGAYALARRAAGLAIIPALLAGALYGLGGHLGAHVEQINQLQGLAWMPWLFLAFHLTLKAPRRYLPLLALGWALQFFSGHTQTTFITGVGLGIYGLLRALPGDSAPRAVVTAALRPVVLLGIAALAAVIIALPQIVPSQELTSLSNRGGGLNAQQVVSFSLNPLLLGRGLLPSYDAQPFGEYVGYMGVAGLVMALLGAGTVWDERRDGRRRWVWLALASIGFFLALGAYNPLYWLLAELPGFNLFRVPARWLALLALGGALLAGIGLQTVLDGPRPARRRMTIIMGISGALALSTLLAGGAADEVNGPAVPALITWVGWGAALIAALFLVTRAAALPRRSLSALALLLVLGELWLASQTLPYNDLSDPDLYHDTRFTIRQMQVYAGETTPPGRLLSISGLLFVPGDTPALERRWNAMGLGARARQYAFTGTKMREALAANLHLIWHVPTIDGFDGGLLPTLHYTAFTSLLLPEGALRTVDGRLREALARPECRGACLPEDRWLDLTHTRYLLTDKVYDRALDGIFYDTQLPIPLQAGERYTLDDLSPFEADALHVLFVPGPDCASPAACAPSATFIYDDGEQVALAAADADLPQVDDLFLLRLDAPQARTPIALIIDTASPVTVRALTLVDRRTGDFAQVAPAGWRRVYSADVKVYENLDVLPRAFIVPAVELFPDDWDGTEAALDFMRQPDFDPGQMAVINTDAAFERDDGGGGGSVTIMAYTARRVTLQVEADSPGWLVLTDAYYPGWRAYNSVVDGPYPIYRADVMFRAVRVIPGAQTITFEYRPFWLGSDALLVYTLLLAGLGGMWWLAGMAFKLARRSSEYWRASSLR